MTTSRTTKTRGQKHISKIAIHMAGLMLLVFSAGEVLAKDSTPKEEPFIITAHKVTQPAKIGEHVDGKMAWHRLKKGDVVEEGQIIRTGLGAEVVLLFGKKGARGRTTIKAGTKIGFSALIKKGNTCGSQLRIKYGAINAEIDSTNGKKNDYRVRTAGGTLSARGTGGNIGFSADRGMGIDGKHGLWALAGRNGVKQTIRKGQSGNSKGTLAKHLLGELLDNKMTDAFGLTNSETGAIIDNKPIFDQDGPGGHNQMGMFRPNTGMGAFNPQLYKMFWSGHGNYNVTCNEKVTWSGHGGWYQSHNGLHGAWAGHGTIVGNDGSSLAGAHLRGAGLANASNAPAKIWVGQFNATSGSLTPTEPGPGGTWSAGGQSFYGHFPHAEPGDTSGSGSGSEMISP